MVTDQEITQRSRKHSVVYIISTIALVGGLVIGYAFGVYNTSSSAHEEGYEQARADIRQRVSGDSGTSGQGASFGGGGLLGLPSSEVTTITGTITQVGADKLVVESTTLNPDPISDPFPTTRTVLVDDSTVIKIKKRKSDEVYNLELEKFFAENDETRDGQIVPPVLGGIRDDGPIVLPPSEYEDVEGSIDSVVENASVTVTAETDIGNEVTFTASTIFVRIESVE